ncbi:MAG: hypothetical protein WCO60_05685 [Verrucomicrobiota bacterium]
MKTKLFRTLRHLLVCLLAALLLSGLGYLGIQWFQSRIDPKPESDVQQTVTDKGTSYKLSQGNLYQVSRWTGKWKFVKQIYDPDFYKNNYVERDGIIFRKADNNDLIPVRRSFSDGFEEAHKLADLIGPKRGWSCVELQSPKAPSVRDYVALRHRILNGESDFLDNRLEPTTEVVHTGHSALKAVSVPPSRSMVTAKASLSTELLHFVKGDDVWLSVWCYVPNGSGMPYTVLDFESTWLDQHPGPRIVITDGKYACIQLKWAGHRFYRQPKGKEVLFPTGQWVHLVEHLTLSEKEDGVIQLWQDGQLLIDSRGQTLILANTIYNSFEIGISAFNENKECVLYVDDVSISDQKIDP